MDDKALREKVDEVCAALGINYGDATLLAFAREMIEKTDTEWRHALGIVGDAEMARVELDERISDLRREIESQVREETVAERVQLQDHLKEALILLAIREPRPPEAWLRELDAALKEAPRE